MSTALTVRAGTLGRLLVARNGVGWVLSPMGAPPGCGAVGGMPAADTVLLPICVGLTLLGIIVTGLAWRRRSKGRVIQGVGLALAPIGLYFSGLLRLLWDGAVALGGWASKIFFSPAVWFGLSALGLCIVLWVVGGVVARRARPRAKAVPSKSSAAALPAKGKSARNEPPVDDDMAEIEALLKARGIE